MSSIIINDQEYKEILVMDENNGLIASITAEDIIINDKHKVELVPLD